MRRYLPLLIAAFLVVVVAFAGTFLAGYAGRPGPAAARFVVVYTTLPVEPAGLLAQAFEKASGVRADIVPLSVPDFLSRAKAEAAAPRADVFLTSAAVLDSAKKAGLLEPHTSEQTDIVPSRFSEADDYWTGVWYDPMVFAANKDYLKKQPAPPARWADLTRDASCRLALTDFLAAEASANLLFAMTAATGEEATLAYLSRLHPHIVQYAKFLATPVRMVGLGEADIAVAVQSEVRRYAADGFPVQALMPADGTAVFLTGAALAKRAPRAAEARKLIDWLIGDQAQQVLFANRYFFVPTNPEAATGRHYDTKDLKLFEEKTALTETQKTRLLDKWVQTVRLAPR